MKNTMALTLAQRGISDLVAKDTEWSPGEAPFVELPYQKYLSVILSDPDDLAYKNSWTKRMKMME